MPTPIFIGKLLGGAYSTQEMIKVWSEENFINKVLKIEEALAKAQAELNIIPKEAAEEISEAVIRGLPVDKVTEVKGDARHLMVSIMYAFQNEVGEKAEYFHLGPTTQDILDTSLTLMIRESLEIIINDLKRLLTVLIEHAKKYKYAVMPGRTHGQHAVPITFGLKLSFWADELADHIVRLREAYERISYLTLSGAVGTMASFTYICDSDNNKVFKLHELTAKFLNLKPAYTDLHQRIDRFSEITNILSLISSTIGKIGLEIRDLSREEVHEIFEPWTIGIHGSSTMPQKRNPEPSEWLEGLAKIVRALSLSMSGITMQHERDATRMAPEFFTLPITFMITHSQIKSLTKILEGIQVFTDNMRRNLYISKGFMAAEPLMLELAKRTGRKVTAHKLVYEVVQKAINENKTFKEAVLESSEIMKYLNRNEIERILNLESYIGTAPEQIDIIEKKVLKILEA